MSSVNKTEKPPFNAVTRQEKIDVESKISQIEQNCLKWPISQSGKTRFCQNAIEM